MESFEVKTRIVICTLLLALSRVVSATELKFDKPVLFAGERFKVPGNSILIASLDDGALALKYEGKSKSKFFNSNYIIFSVDNLAKEFKASCSSTDLLEAAFSGSDSSCEGDIISVFRKVFIEGSPTGSWTLGKKKYYYINKPKMETEIFTLDKEGKVIRIHSSIIPFSQLKQLIDVKPTSTD